MYEIIEKVFHYEENELSVVKFEAILLGYKDHEDKIMLDRLIENGEGQTLSPKRVSRDSVYILL